MIRKIIKSEDVDIRDAYQRVSRTLAEVNERMVDFRELRIQADRLFKMWHHKHGLLLQLGQDKSPEEYNKLISELKKQDKKIDKLKRRLGLEVIPMDYEENNYDEDIEG